MRYLSVITAALAVSIHAAPHRSHCGHNGSQRGPNRQGAHGRSVCSPAAQALYLLTNNAANAVAALPIATDGTLGEGKLTETGGAGANSVNGATGNPAVPDALVSQSALTRAGNLKFIFAVNPGSNTLSMLTISESDPTALTVVGEPVALPGEFPNTVAASLANGLACVGTTGSLAGISCSSFSSGGLSKMDSLRPFELNQSTPPVGPTNTVSHTFFSEDGSMLFTTVKGDPTVNNTGFLSMFTVEGLEGSSQLSTEGTTSSPNGTAVLFGSTVIPGKKDQIFATDASFGAAVLSVDATSGAAEVVGKSAIEGQAATCWAVISPATKTAFVADVAVNRLVEMSLEDASIIGKVDLFANGDPGLTDMAAAGNFLYALSPGNGTTEPAVTVLDVSGGSGTASQIQHFGLGGMGVTANAVGMVVLI